MQLLLGIEILLFFMSPPWLGGIETKLDVLRMGEETKFLKRRVKNHICSGFENLYTTGLDMAPLSSPISQFSCCYFTDKDQAWIGRAVNEEDVRDGLCWVFSAVLA